MQNEFSLLISGLEGLDSWQKKSKQSLKGQCHEIFYSLFSWILSIFLKYSEDELSIFPNGLNMMGMFVCVKNSAVSLTTQCHWHVKLGGVIGVQLCMQYQYTAEFLWQRGVRAVIFEYYFFKCTFLLQMGIETKNIFK